MSNDPFHHDLADGLHRLADRVPFEVPDGGRARIDDRARHRAARRRRRMTTGGVAVAVVALAGGVMALRPEPAQRVGLSGGPAGAGPAATGVVTGYSTGSMTGSPQGWTYRYDVDVPVAQLPRLVLDFPAGETWVPTDVYASTSERGSGERTTPLAVAADLRPGQSPRYVVAGIQPASKLGPGKGGTTITIDGRPATIHRERDGQIQLTATLADGRRALVSSSGLDRAAVVDLVASLSESGGTWGFDPDLLAAAGALAPVTTTPVDAAMSRSVSYTLVPSGGSAANVGMGPGETAGLTVRSGGAYEFYASLAQSYGIVGTQVVDPATIELPGVRATAAVAQLGDGWSSVQVLGDDGVVYTIDRSISSADGSPVPLPARQLRSVVADDAAWSTVVLGAAATQAAVEERAAVEGKGRMEAEGAPVVSDMTTTIPPTTEVGPTTIPDLAAQ